MFRSHYCFHLLLWSCLIKGAVQVCEPDDLTSSCCGFPVARILHAAFHTQEILAHKPGSRHMVPCHKSVQGSPRELWHRSSRALWGAVCSGLSAWTSHLVVSTWGVQRRKEGVS